MAFIALNSLGHAVASWIPCLAAAEALWPLWLYPLKIVTVFIALGLGWGAYTELHTPLCRSLREGIMSAGVGI